MKTYKDFYDELYHKKLITGKLEELAAKEYAKQWVDHCERNSFLPKQIAEQFKKQIDEQ